MTAPAKKTDHQPVAPADVTVQFAPDVIEEAQKAIKAAQAVMANSQKFTRETTLLLKQLDEEKKNAQKPAE